MGVHGSECGPTGSVLTQMNGPNESVVWMLKCARLCVRTGWFGPHIDEATEPIGRLSVAVGFQRKEGTD